MQFTKVSAVFGTFLLTMAVSCLADDLASIKKALDSKYTLTTTTADHSDIVTPGAVLVLKRSNLVTTDASKTVVFGNTYKNGRITQSKILSAGRFGEKFGQKTEGLRTFVSGEKVWLTGIDVKEKEVTFELFTDAYSDVRYRARLNFPIEKDSTPTVSGVMGTVAEVFDVQEGDDKTNNNGAPQQPQAPGRPQQAGAAPVQPAVSAEAPPPPIAPPPPPPADPKEIKLGQTPDQVTGILGQPDKVVNLGAKKIFVYKDMRVVFLISVTGFFLVSIHCDSCSATHTCA